MQRMQRFALGSAACFSTLLLAACGGDSGNMGSPPSTSATVMLSTANVDLAARAAANATLSSANVVDVNPASAGSKTASAVASARGRSVQELMFNLTRQVVVDRVAPESGLAKVAGLISRTDACAVSGTVTAVLDDRDNSGAASSGDVLTVTFAQCRPNATDLIDGTVAATYSVVQASPVTSISATVTYSHLLATSTEGSFSIDGSFTYNLTRVGVVTTAQLSIGTNGLTAVVAGSNYNDTVTLHAGYTVTASRDPLAFPPGSTIGGVRTLSVNGAISATSLGGTIVISTPATIRQYDIDPFPREGQLQVRGANNGLLVLTVVSTTSVRVQLDANADGLFEVDKIVAWAVLI